MECMCVQTRPLFMLSSKGFLGNGVRIHVNSKGKIPCAGSLEEGLTRDAASRRTAKPDEVEFIRENESRKVGKALGTAVLTLSSLRRS